MSHHHTEYIDRQSQMKGTPENKTTLSHSIPSKSVRKLKCSNSWWNKTPNTIGPWVSDICVQRRLARRSDEEGDHQCPKHLICKMDFCPVIELWDILCGRTYDLGCLIVWLKSLTLRYNMLVFTKCCCCVLGLCVRKYGSSICLSKTFISTFFLQFLLFSFWFPSCLQHAIIFCPRLRGASPYPDGRINTLYAPQLSITGFIHVLPVKGPWEADL